MGFRNIRVLALVAMLQACATSESVNSINQSQQQIQQVLNDQAEQIQNQADHIEHLQLLQGALNHMLSEMSVELDMVNERLEAYKPGAGASKPPATPTSKTAKPSTLGENGKILLGRTEWVWLDALDQTIDAEMNTGVRNSLLYVKNSQIFERDGRDWVRFELAGPDAAELETAEFEAPVVRMTKIRLVADGQYDKRPTIKTNIRIGTHVEQAEFVLTPSVKIAAQAVLGRNFLRDIAVVDVARKHIQPKYKPNAL